MKKLIAFFLGAVMCLTFVACGGNKDETTSVSTSVSTSMSTSAIDSDNFDTEYAAMIERVEELNADTSIITGIVYETWSNAGPSDFYTFYGAIFAITEGMTLDAVPITRLAAAACALLPGKYWDDSAMANRNLSNAVNVLKADSAKAQEVLDTAIGFNRLYNLVIVSDEVLSADMKEFKEKYKDKYEEEVDTLREWILESSMYVEYAVNPSGTLIEYGNGITEYEQNLSRFSKIANSY